MATFAAGDISFSGDTNYSLGGFLSSGGATGIGYMNGASATTDLNYTLWEFTGSAFSTHGQTFSALHDDGLIYGECCGGAADFRLRWWRWAGRCYSARRYLIGQALGI